VAKFYADLKKLKKVLPEEENYNKIINEGG
jgi:hypothetical protein